eukprot:Blabericola_migrator_1__8822@NODE_465_length_8250_cov_107_590737_g363_i0_p2_GENE_NODE_465_length_8250_cov_107_590737_g363_i0NODE_465_length_8250_cov_107_590737_g363_i0_p2_ORF_typecomplete_len714_score87_68DZR/PF12773_7/0_019DZR/PF12773_7/24zfribbon_3/PF13248_6/2_3zfribbon_3/PF13248_6/0_48zfribbon_3/PF13248_6/3e02CDC24_OB3/PF17244_2/0_42CDC24_OB3/PF17244_2/4_4e02DUF2614/PF11023_8/3_9e03DUF2614/PF11023_8/0_88DUF2614/PF11023_8/1_3e03ProkRING_1/PF14446_6/29ProkRING_1/PF14446_6/0_21ProkRING_1/PF14446
MFQGPINDSFWGCGVCGAHQDTSVAICSICGTRRAREPITRLTPIELEIAAVQRNNHNIHTNKSRPSIASQVPRNVTNRSWQQKKAGNANFRCPKCKHTVHNPDIIACANCGVALRQDYPGAPSLIQIKSRLSPREMTRQRRGRYALDANPYVKKQNRKNVYEALRSSSSSSARSSHDDSPSKPREPQGDGEEARATSVASQRQRRRQRLLDQGRSLVPVEVVGGEQTQPVTSDAMKQMWSSVLGCHLSHMQVWCLDSPPCKLSCDFCGGLYDEFLLEIARGDRVISRMARFMLQPREAGISPPEIECESCGNNVLAGLEAIESIKEVLDCVLLPPSLQVASYGPQALTQAQAAGADDERTLLESESNPRFSLTALAASQPSQPQNLRVSRDAPTLTEDGSQRSPPNSLKVFDCESDLPYQDSTSWRPPPPPSIVGRLAQSSDPSGVGTSGAFPGGSDGDFGTRDDGSLALLSYPTLTPSLGIDPVGMRTADDYRSVTSDASHFDTLAGNQFAEAVPPGLHISGAVESLMRPTQPVPGSLGLLNSCFHKGSVAEVIGEFLLRTRFVFIVVDSTNQMDEIVAMLSDCMGYNAVATEGHIESILSSRGDQVMQSATFPRMLHLVKDPLLYTHLVSKISRLLQGTGGNRERRGASIPVYRFGLLAVCPEDREGNHKSLSWPVIHPDQLLVINTSAQYLLLKRMIQQLGWMTAIASL